MVEVAAVEVEVLSRTHSPDHKVKGGCSSRPIPRSQTPLILQDATTAHPSLWTLISNHNAHRKDQTALGGEALASPLGEVGLLQRPQPKGPEGRVRTQLEVGLGHVGVLNQKESGNCFVWLFLDIAANVFGPSYQEHLLPPQKSSLCNASRESLTA
jgi:hypothetical protein